MLIQDPLSLVSGDDSHSDYAQLGFLPNNGWMREWFPKIRG